jgi:DNA adenine methylase
MSQTNRATLPPFLKWAGGKRWLASTFGDLLPRHLDGYFEPFLGGGALFFSLAPEKAVLSDLNERLIACYAQIKTDPHRFAALMRAHQRAHSREYYYETRAKRLRSPLQRAAQFLYLNRTCWNGLYRVNLNGVFNVPKGTKDKIVIEGESFSEYATALQGATLHSCDFEETIDRTKRGDFLFADPPYTVKHNFNGFAKYNEEIFRWSDQIRLRKALDRAASRGVKILLSNAHHESVLELFSDLGTVHIVNRASVIAADAGYRSRVTEIVVCVNYEAGHADGRNRLTNIKKSERARKPSRATEHRSRG